jgi:hypothetical protein
MIPFLTMNRPGNLGGLDHLPTFPGRFSRVVVLGWKSDWFVGKFAQLEGGFPPLEDRGKTT